MIERPKSNFLKLKCDKCRNEQIVFSKASTIVKCLVCGAVLLEPSGGNAAIKSKVVETLD